MMKKAIIVSMMLSLVVLGSGCASQPQEEKEQQDSDKKREEINKRTRKKEAALRSEIGQPPTLSKNDGESYARLEKAIGKLNRLRFAGNGEALKSICAKILGRLNPAEYADFDHELRKAKPPISASDIQTVIKESPAERCRQGNRSSPGEEEAENAVGQSR